MPKIFFLAAGTFLFSLSVAFAGKLFEPIQAKLLRTSDGDTAEVRREGESTKNEKLRFIGIDAPELHLLVGDQWMGQIPWGQEATDALRSWVPDGNQIRFLDFGSDKYHRTLARVYLGKVDINLKMVKEGWAIPYPICGEDVCTPSYIKILNLREYQAACVAARRRGRGIWNFKGPLKEMPFEFRRRLLNQSFDRWVGDIITKTLFEPEDYTRVDVCNRIFFSSRQVGEAAGYQLP